MAPAATTTAELPTITSLLATLTEALESTGSSLPAPQACLPPANGISLLDLKNELMLSYIHNLVFFLLVKIRGGEGEEAEACVKKLVEARTWLERGIRPVESKLRYQIDKVVKRSVEYETTAKGGAALLKNGAGADGEGSSEEEEDDDEDGDDDGDESTKATKVIMSYDIDGVPTSGKAVPEITTTAGALTEELSFRPNPIVLPRATAGSDSEDGGKRGSKDSNPNGLYRPPRISATAMPSALPTTTTATPTAAPRLSKKSHSLDAFIASELSSAPAPEPSIGSTIAASGRGSKSHQDRREEQERREYEENNFVRLPGLSKAERRKKMEKDARFAGDMFGGEDWRGFAGDLDRLTARATRVGKGSAALEKSRKRKDGGGGGGDGEGSGAGKKARIGRHFSRVVGNENRRKK